ncbi:MAG: 30S ribosomal protein S18 [Caldilineaceae bacterium]
MSNQPNVVDNEVESSEEPVVAIEEIEDVIPPAIETDEVVEEDEDAGGPAEYAASEGGRTGRGGGNLRADDIDYKNVTQLSRFLDRRGRILSRRKTRVNAKTQRKIAIAVKRARHLALLPYTADQTRIVRKRR